MTKTTEEMKKETIVLKNSIFDIPVFTEAFNRVSSINDPALFVYQWKKLSKVMTANQEIFAETRVAVAKSLGFKVDRNKSFQIDPEKRAEYAEKMKPIWDEPFDTGLPLIEYITELKFNTTEFELLVDIFDTTKHDAKLERELLKSEKKEG
jgi:hypothetical protein